MIFLTFAAAIVGAPAALSATGRVPLARFDGSAHRLDHKWAEQNDPVMGGKSSGECSVNAANSTLIFTGAP